MLPARSQLGRLTAPDHFVWLTGIEDTFITAPWPETGRTLDEYELTRHYELWREDLGLMASLGVSAARYGIPWHRVQPGPKRWEWVWADRPLERMLELGVEPVVDLVHYGLPGWLEGAFTARDYPERVAEYAGRVAERFRGRIRWYTPLNEPRITAWYCGRLGWWPPFLHGWRGFVAVLKGVVHGIVRTVETVRSVDPEAVCLHVDAGDLYTAETPSQRQEAQERQEIGFLGLDLVSGRVGEDHPLLGLLRKGGFKDEDLAWLREHGSPADLVGINLYPMFSNKRVCRRRGCLRIGSRYGSAETVERLLELYCERYGRPVMITETAARGRNRAAWLEESVGAVRRLRSRGVPVVGYTWWPMFALIQWAYRQGRREPAECLEQLGLWDLDPDAGLRRVETPLVEAYRELAAGGSRAVGRLAPSALPGGRG